MKRQIFKILIIVAALIQCPMIYGNETIVSGVSPNAKNAIGAHITKLTAQLIGGKLEMQNHPFKRMLLMMKAGELDFMAGLLKTKEREKYIHYLSRPYIETVEFIFLVGKGKRQKIKKFEDLYGLKIGTTIGTKYFERFDNDKRIQKHRNTRLKFLLKMLLAKRIDAVICTLRTGVRAAKKRGVINRIEIAKYRDTKNNPVYIGISKRSKLMYRIDEIEEVITGAVKSGKFIRVIDRYYDKDIWIEAFNSDKN